MDPEGAVRWNVTIAEGSAIAATGIGALGLVGWLTGVVGLTRWTDASVPIAPVTAVAFVLLGTAAFLYSRWPARLAARRAVAVAAAVVAGLCGLVLAQFVAGFDLGLERSLVRSANAALDATAALVSPLTALALLLAAASLLNRLAFPQGANAAAGPAAILGGGVLAIALTALAGFAAGRPLLYGSAVKPMAVSTASGLALLGAALVASALARPALLATDAPTGPTAGPSQRIAYVPLTLVAGAGLLFSAVFATIVFRLEEGRRRNDFTGRADHTLTVLRSTLAGAIDAVDDVRSLFVASEGVRRYEFRAFVTAQLSYGLGLQSLSWAPRVANRQRAGFEAAARKDGVPNFSVAEFDAGGTPVPAARRAEYFPAYYIQTRLEEDVGPGFDFASEATRRAALDRARDGGTASASAPFTLPIPGAPLGVLLASPVYRRGAPVGEVAVRRAALVGFAVGDLRIDELVAAVQLAARAPDVALDLVDVSDRAHPTPLYADTAARATQSGTLETAAELHVGGRSWRIRFRPSAAFVASRRIGDAWYVFGAGLLLTILIAAYLYSRERYSAELEVARRLAAESEGRFRAIAESAVDAIITIDARGTIVQCNAAAMREFGYEEDGLLGRNVRDLVPPGLAAAHTDGLSRYGATGQALVVGEAHELPALRRDGSEFPIELSLATWETHEGRFATAILRNIADRKSVREERERLIGELQDALAGIKTLRGLLPVCAWCRKVLDDRGAWRQMEAYVSEHTEAEFSHGMCPDCAQRFEAGEI